MSRAAFIAKFRQLTVFDPEASAAIETLGIRRLRVRRRTNIVSEGDRPSGMIVISSGWAGRSVMRRKGSRRITGLLLPGDFCGIHALCGTPYDHSIAALTDCDVGFIAMGTVQELTRHHPSAGDGILRAKLIEEATLRRWLSLSDDAQRALAHLICELAERIAQIDGSYRYDFEIPITQEDIGDALGLTAVHVNRTMRQLRELGVISMTGRVVCILKRAELERIARFDGNYLGAGLRRPAERSQEMIATSVHS